MSWGISENTSEKEKLKAEVNDYFHGLNAVGEIDWIAYSELYDACMPILDKCYDRMKIDRLEDEIADLNNQIEEYQQMLDDLESEGEE